ncbi:MAG TPA: hypothetical protein VH814_26075 [Steroidobacteraceae bacterium]|jgi:hypothetical protein
MNAHSALGHLRQVLIVIAGVLAMYLLASWTGRVLSRMFAVGQYELFIWIDRLVFFLWGVLAGALLVRLLTWRLRLLGTLALPVLVLLVVPNVAYLRARAIIQGDVSYLAMWPYYVYLGVPVLGMIVGGLLAARRRTIASQ